MANPESTINIKSNITGDDGKNIICGFICFKCSLFINNRRLSSVYIDYNYTIVV